MRCYCFTLKDGTYTEIWAEKYEVHVDKIMCREVLQLIRGDLVIAGVDPGQIAAYTIVEQAGGGENG